MSILHTRRTTRSCITTVAALAVAVVATAGVAAVVVGALWVLYRVSVRVARRVDELFAPVRAAHDSVRRFRARQHAAEAALLSRPFVQRCVLSVLSAGIACTLSAPVAADLGVDRWSAAAFVAGASAVAAYAFDRARPVFGGLAAVLPVFRLRLLLGAAFVIAKAAVKYAGDGITFGWSAGTVGTVVVIVVAVTAASLALALIVATWDHTSWAHVVAGVAVMLYDVRDLHQVGVPLWVTVTVGMVIVIPFGAAQYAPRTQPEH